MRNALQIRGCERRDTEKLSTIHSEIGGLQGDGITQVNSNKSTDETIREFFRVPRSSEQFGSFWSLVDHPWTTRSCSKDSFQHEKS